MIRLFAHFFNLLILLFRITPKNNDQTLIIQPLPGIGDMIWHLPHIHSIAAISKTGKVSILTKPRSKADRLLSGDPYVDQVLWLERNPGKHDGVSGFFRLVAELRKYTFTSVWILHDSNRYAWASFFAGIPVRRGYGQGIQHLLLSDPIHLDKTQLKLHPITISDLLLKEYAVPKIEPEPVLLLAPETTSKIDKQFASIKKPWIIIGMGSSEPVKQWGEERFAELIITLRQTHDCSIFLAGGSTEQGMADYITNKVSEVSIEVHQAIELPIDHIAALVAQSSLYVGNDTGLLNMAASLKIPSIGLFGRSPPLKHSQYIHCIQAPQPEQGMVGITVAHVLKIINELFSQGKYQQRQSHSTK
jgi:heptosyltransferase-2